MHKQTSKTTFAVHIQEFLHKRKQKCKREKIIYNNTLYVHMFGATILHQPRKLYTSVDCDA